MDNLDLDLLTQLIGLLRETGVTQFTQGDLHLVLAPMPDQTQPSGDKNVVPTKRSQYAGLFNGRVPSFDQYRESGLVTEES